MGNRIDSHACVGCGECQMVCPENNIAGLDEGVSEIENPELCPGECSSCSDVCPVGAIIIESEE